MRHHLPLTKLLYDIDGTLTPALTVKSGDEVVVETEDAMSGQIREAGDRRDKVAQPRYNPVNGPIAITDAHPGDTVHMRIDSIDPLIGQCATYLWPYPDIVENLGRGLVDQTRVCSIRNGGVVWNDRLTLAYEPMIGVVATTPPGERVSTGPAGDYGGNMDLRDVKPGSTVSLPIFIPGGSVFLGDCHARQGDAEVGGTALEMPARVRIVIELERGTTIPGPRISSPEALASVATGDTLEKAVSLAAARLAMWLEDRGGIDRWEAYSLITQVGEVSLGYPTTRVAAVKIGRKYL